MCGLAGFYAPQGCDADEGWQVLARMGEAISHRGPDQRAEWLDEEAGIGLASRRLAIIDLSPAGHQPMESASGRFVISYNGEIYNHLGLRTELETAGQAPQWRGSSDTETLLAAIEAWGLAATLERSVGMYALALWDRREHGLVLARDRLGEKPMYYGWQGTGRGRIFLFGSELKALARHPKFGGEVDRGALAAYMGEGYIPAPQSIYLGIFKLAPGHIATLGPATEQPRLEHYWSAAGAVEQGVSNRLDIGEEEAIDRLDGVLGRAVAGELIGDVPVGAFLSGGIDSSVIVALMQRASSVPVKTFTIGFEDQRFDEAPYARAVADHLGTDHHELTISAQDALSTVPLLPAIYDEPFADSSQVPTYLLSKLARSRVTVALSGDGGDELFAGYEKYSHSERLWRHLRNVPSPVRRAAGAALRAIPPRLWNGFGRIAGVERAHSTLSDQLAKGANLLGARSPAEIGRGIAQRWNGGAVVIGADERSGLEPNPALGPIESLMACDLVRYLPDDILVKVDRATMAVSLETRAPYLDHRVVEFAWRLPLDKKMRAGTTKWILRRLLARYVPESLFERPKRGFGIPIDEWLRGPLRTWAEELLSPERLRNEGYFRPELIRTAWQAHLSGRSNRQAQLWTVLMFEAWLEAQKARRTPDVERSPVPAAAE